MQNCPEMKNEQNMMLKLKSLKTHLCRAKRIQHDTGKSFGLTVQPDLNESYIHKHILNELAAGVIWVYYPLLIRHKLEFVFVVSTILKL